MAITTKEVPIVRGGVIYKMHGLSTDTKPMNAPNASTFHEIDTGKDFEISVPEDGSPEWYEQPTGGGGGGDDTDYLTDDDIENAWG